MRDRANLYDLAGFVFVILVLSYLLAGCSGSKEQVIEPRMIPRYESPRAGQEQIFMERHTPPIDMKPLAIPGFAVAVPEGHFAGISQPSVTIASARHSAINDVIRQVVGSMNSDATAKFKERMRVDDLSARHTVDDNLDVIARGLVVGVEENIVDTVWVTDALGRYMCYILVRYPKELIDEMRRISRGAHLIPSVDIGSYGAKLNVHESNGV